MSDLLEEKFIITGEQFLHISANLKMVKIGLQDSIQGSQYVEEIENLLQKIYEQKVNE